VRGSSKFCDNEGVVVANRTIASMRGEGARDAFDYDRSGFAAVRAEQLEETSLAKFLARAVEGLCDAIGVKDEFVSRAEGTF
jgi:hypothetical protein